MTKQVNKQLKEIVRATCGGCSPSLQDYILDSLKQIYKSAKEKK